MPLTRFDRIVWAVLALLMLAIAGVMLAGDRVGVAIELLYLEPGGQVGGRSPLTLRFDQPMRTATVADGLSIEPDIPINLTWQGDHLIIVPAAAWELGEEYRLRIAAGAQSELGHSLLEDYTFTFSARPAGIAYVLETEIGRQLWALPDVGGEPIQLSAAEQIVFDFGVAPDGSRIAFSVINEDGGLDLWLVDRQGGEPRLFLDCGADRCSDPSWAPDGASIAYSRAPAGLDEGQPYGPTRIWLLDVFTGDTLRLHADTQKLGYAPSWSPDGGRLAYFDGVEGRIVVVDMDGGGETYLPTTAGLVGSWSPGGEQMLYHDVQVLDAGALNVIYRADFVNQDVLPLFDPPPGDGDYSSPLWSPDGARVAFKGRPAEMGPGDQIWITPPDGAFALVVSGDPDYLHADLSWDPWGTQLLFKRIPLGVPFPEQEVWLWSGVDNSLRQILPDAMLPAWLP